ncbi:DUF4118 domain-containing protein [Novosphingobium flavum]|uniref:histidine kinase n=1 Tax=Novosphingobium flavum TaxID=1778672 RepID=A0A7X1FTS3_9SPHN|nr:histidine kinase dimerization/phosphoacceptor domain -containing protein [Novosphingobium flavum]MBC2666202.1 DUF4118 domain-containing protein [Novosphingobium flavum]
MSIESKSRVDQTRLIHWLSRLPLAQERPLVGFLFAVLCSLIALLLRWELDSTLPAGFPFVTFFPAVIASAFFFGLWPGIVSAVLCGLLSWYLFVPPVHSLSLAGGAGAAMALYAFVVVVDITLVHLMQRTFRQLDLERETSRQLADHREVLFRELQHRIGNNLQMVGALLSLQKRHVTDEEGRAALDEAGRRLRLIGQVQRQLYDPSVNRLGLGPFLGEITRDIVSSSGEARIEYVIEGGEGVAINPDSAIPLALIVAEAIANAIEHGIGPVGKGMLRLSIEHGNGHFLVHIENDGQPLPHNFDPAAFNSLGLRLANSLAAGRGGAFSLAPGGLGTRATVTMPLVAAPG